MTEVGEGVGWMAATVSGIKAAVLRLLEDLVAACDFAEWGRSGTRVLWALAVEGSHGARLLAEAPRIWLRYHLLTLALGK